MGRIAVLLPALAGLILLGAAPPPRALAGVQPGLWEVSRSATGHGARRMCVTELVELAHAAHPGERCRRTILSDRSGQLLLDLQCDNGDVGRSRISVVTPRSLKVELQGIHRGLPFDQTLYARRAGACPRSLARR